jgi:hypothetical protein
VGPACPSYEGPTDDQVKLVPPKALRSEYSASIIDGERYAPTCMTRKGKRARHRASPIGRGRFMPNQKVGMTPWLERDPSVVLSSEMMVEGGGRG